MTRKREDRKHGLTRREVLAGAGAVSLGADGRSLGNRNAPALTYIGLTPDFSRLENGGFLGDFGFEPLGNEGFQYFDVIMSVEPGEYNKLTFSGIEKKFNEDFKPMPFSANAKLEAEVVFAGFGFDIEHDSLTWNDYKEVNVEGKWVLILRGDPEPENDESLFISYGNDRDKVLTARDQKASGVLLVSGPQFGSEDKLVELKNNAMNLAKPDAAKIIAINALKYMETV